MLGGVRRAVHHLQVLQRLRFSVYPQHVHLQRVELTRHHQRVERPAEVAGRQLTQRPRADRLVVRAEPGQTDAHRVLGHTW